MAREWTDADIEKARELLTKVNDCTIEIFSAVMHCTKPEARTLCRRAWDMSFEKAKEHWHLVGDALAECNIFDAAMEGNSKAIDTLTRRRFGGPVEIRRKAAESEAARPRRNAL